MSRILRPRGALIIFEGCDRCGKTTQVNKLVDSLNIDGIPVKQWRFPDRETAIGKMISSYLSKESDVEDHAIHLLFSANRWEAVPRMLKLLQGGTTLLVDRYAYSGVAFTAAKPGFDMEWCRKPDMGLPLPDKVMYLTLSSEEAAKRGSFGLERYEQTAFQDIVASNFKKLREPNWEIIDANKSVEDLHRELKDKVKSVIDSVGDSTIAKLWMPLKPSTPS